MNEIAPHSVHLQISHLKNLPALPEASVKILEAINDPDITIEKLVDALTLSPSLVARLLGLANSAYFSQQRKIDSLHTAIVQVLGLNLVKSLAVGIVLNVQLDPGKCKNFDTQLFWQHSLMTASIAQKLFISTSTSDLTVATVYTGGLLLSIGVLVVAFLFPEDLSRILLTQTASYDEIGKSINRELGLSHYQIGYMLLNKWQLPDIYQAMLQQFEQDNSTGDTARLICLLQASVAICYLVLDKNSKDDVSLESIADRAKLPLERVDKVFHEMLENKENIQKLAMALGS